GVKIERRFDFIDCLTMKVLFHACQVSSNTVVVHRFPIRILVVTNPQLMLAAMPFLSKVCSSPQKRTLVGRAVMSALCQKRTHALQQKGYVCWAFVRISRRRSKLSADQTELRS